MRITSTSGWAAVRLGEGRSAALTRFGRRQVSAVELASYGQVVNRLRLGLSTGTRGAVG